MTIRLAISFGSLSDADMVIAFSPQTFIGNVRRILYRDSRWNEEMKKVHGSVLAQRNCIDLKGFLRQHRNRKTAFPLYYYRREKLAMA